MNTRWKPKIWIAVLLAFVTGSFAFLYLNKLRLFWIYFVISLVVLAIDWYFHLYCSLAVTFACVIHTYLTAKNYNIDLPRHWYSRWWVIPVIYVAIIAPVVLARMFIFDLFSIPAASMSPTINIGNYIVVKKHGYGDYGAFGIRVFNTGLAKGVELAPGKIYVFYPPHKPKTPFVKRLIGVPGDQIDIKGDQLWINGTLVEHRVLSEDSNYIYSEERIGETSYQIQRTKTKPFLTDVSITVPRGYYFVLGDNRDNSADSRTWGLVSDHSFIGEMVFLVKI